MENRDFKTPGNQKDIFKNSAQVLHFMSDDNKMNEKFFLWHCIQNQA